jgi:prepilin-type N-terminal cleavage/methylation domain-containing protein
MSQRTRAFTLIELLIVVAIIAILAAIAVPNFLEAQVRSKVSRAQGDLRTLATALESYKVDWNRYPADWVVERVDDGSGNSLISEGFIPPRISTPVAYLSSASLPDPFVLSKAGQIPNTDLYWPAANLFYQSVEHSMRAAGHPSFATGPAGRTVPEYQRQQPAASYQARKVQAGWLARNWHESYGLWKAGSIGPIRRYNGGDNTYDPSNGTISEGDLYRSQKKPIGSSD